MCYKIITGAAVSQEAQNETNTSGGDEHVLLVLLHLKRSLLYRHPCPQNKCLIKLLLVTNQEEYQLANSQAVPSTHRL